MSVPDFRDALSSFKQSVSEKYRRFVDWTGYRRKKNYLKRVYRDYFKSNLFKYGKAYGKYVLFDIAPYVVAYGLMINFPLSVLLGWALTVETVVSWGLVFYLIDEEVTSIFNEIKPYVRVSAKVDN